MRNLHATAVRFLRDQSGATVIEYGLLISLMGSALVLTVGPIGQWIGSIFTRLSAALQPA